jgi:flagellar biosynthesis/type III secretory pathway protein FliH
MQRLKLSNGSYVHPGEVNRLQVKKHFLAKNYYVQMHLNDGRAIDLRTELSEAEARELRTHYEQQLETLAADISAYEEGLTAGLSRGKKLGYEEGYRNGYNEGSAAAPREANDQAFRSEIDAVLEQLKLRQYEFRDEMRFQEHLVEARRQSLLAMNDLIDSIVAMFTPQQWEGADPDRC